MEVTDISNTSVLKKPDSLNKKLKKVSFNNTVKLYIDDPSKNSKPENGYISQMKWVEINIVDKSNNSLVPDTYEDCKVTDFLVHKVIYDNYVLPEDDNDLDVKNEDNEDPIVFESTYEEGLEFVVHKVTEYENDLIDGESEFDDASDEVQNECSSDIQTNEDSMKESCKLSIENILEHDKIIAFIDQKNLCLPLHNLNLSDLPNSGANKLANMPEKSNSRLGLSPPLQELSLEKIVKAHSDNILSELDISPLNSVQETDSDSDISSEGTMIMMTSEECEKNEQHIKESLLKYQSMKEKIKTETLEDAVQLTTEASRVLNSENIKKTSDEKLELSDNLLNPLDSHHENSSNILTSNCDFPQQLQSCDQQQITFSPIAESLTPKDCRSFSLSDVELLHSLCENSFQNHSNKSRKGSLNGDSFWDQSLTSVEIPKDVREWKIFLKSFEKNQETSNQCDDSIHMQSIKQSEIDRIQTESNNISQSQMYSDVFYTSYNDELENFVHENTERVERIRKRYLINGKERIKQHCFEYSPNRGIRPRFGSTAQILQLMQKQSNPPFYTFSGTKTHMSWPCDDAGSDSEIQRNIRHKHFYVSQSLSSDCSSQSSFDSDEYLSSTNCDQYSDSCCPSLLLQERGRPEGASPPRPGVEDHLEQSYDETSDSYVYFSMKV